MAATNSASTNGSTLRYGVAYGALSTTQKLEDSKLETMTAITKEELKASQSKNESLDLRGKYIKTDNADYPYKVFYEEIQNAKVVSIEKEQVDGFGMFTKITVLDKDGDTCIIQMKHFNKYTEDVLNRLLACKDVSSDFTFRPYSIPDSFKDEKSGKTINYNNMGISVRENGEKLKGKYTYEDKELPSTERVMNNEGVEVTSRVKRVTFLFDKAVEMFKGNVLETNKNEVVDDEDDDLPF